MDKDDIKLPDSFRPEKNLDEKTEQLINESKLNHAYKFRLREDMPKGFKANPNYPELPAIYNFLKEYEGYTFKSTEKFQKDVLDKFLQYLEDEKVPQSTDRMLREGLYLREIPDQPDTKELKWEYFVETKSSTPAGVCVFGMVERIKE
ncbi:MAG: hypothetical protein KKA79_06110 [Nanoarchaeota archaeon]|nr:hypothetical protein [Nanoarchaeota archaeon]